MEKIVFIEDYGYNGEGVGKIDGKVCFIPKTIIGEKILADVEKDNSKFCKASIKKILSASSKRISPKCMYYDKCGGCNFQHMSYSEELEIKKKLFLKEFKKFADIEDIEIVFGESSYGYRNKIRLAVKDKALGFYEENSKDFIPINVCQLVSDKMNDLIKKINLFLKTTMSKFEEVIIFDFNGENLIDFITKDNVRIDELKKFFKCNIEINHKGDIVDFESYGLTTKYDGDAFRQINDEIAKKLYDEVLNYIAKHIVLNAYSGAGMLSALIAKKAKFVYGIEINKSAHTSAEKLKNNNHISNMINICGDVSKEISNLQDLDCVVVDPPRAGCQKSFLMAISNKKVNKIIYISCNQATLVRDLKLLKENYDLESVKLFDMFPRTANCECLVVLNHKKTESLEK